MAAEIRIGWNERLDEDMLLTSVGWANSYYQSDHDYVDEWGVGWTVVEYETRFGRGHYTEMTDHPLARDEAVASYRPPDPHRTELYRDAAWTLREFQHEYWIVGVTVTTIFETAWALRGYERLLTDLLTDPDLAAAILEIPFCYHLVAAQRLVEMGVDMIWVGDDVGSQAGMLLSPELWRRLFKPQWAEFFATLKRTARRCANRCSPSRRRRRRSPLGRNPFPTADCDFG